MTKLFKILSTICGVILLLMIMPSNTSAQAENIVEAPSRAYLFNGSYEIKVLNSNATRVRFPTWTLENGYDDLIWYEGEKMEGNNWRVKIPLSDHNNETGSYVTHIYLTDSTGKENILVEKVVTIAEDPEPVIEYPTTVDISKGYYEIYVSNVFASKVAFPTWTESDDQDDIIWHKGIPMGEGKWKVVIPFVKHNSEAGKYITHIYKYNDKDEQKFVGGGVTEVTGMVSYTKYIYDANGNLIRKQFTWKEYK
ncbi:hypothetical protein PC41400_09080 [Paenibacillus chitinolyticus]|uniref:GBS Bsp-like repeat-containing protein n=1 Tax=Paenibacillus chitinolyticus TaxID=79263 RepID=A0A410WTI7_9BACL|nr:GBS Bsp-like repeat-containing protein [Paenibacillus chitinolyticus]MCY9591366.1 GBS Bsp-like repeat-containing protein [Paenibacillus chitinolyticus]MCY9597427.1 GBS Bsp-like repeat-containing protein [Paenibacillus chitinolyticus]QAV17806.1 hypothetical protein PC41400_09080 [Paenibacillus chitinolyticus]